MAVQKAKQAASEPIKKRDRFLNEASRQFNRRGYFDTRLEDIANHFGIGKTAISYHFKSKEGLLAASYEKSCDFTDCALGQAATESTGLQRALAFIRIVLVRHSDASTGKEHPLALINDISGLAEDDRREITLRYRKQISAFREFLIQGIADGSVAISSPDAGTFFAFNVLNWLPSYLDQVVASKHEATIESVCDLLSNGVSTEDVSGKLQPIVRNSMEAFPTIFDRETRNKLKLEAFLRTGIRHLNRNGYRNLSLEDITAELGVTRGAFYYQIDDKESFLLAACHRTCDLVERALELATDGQSDSALAMLSKAIRRLFEGHLTEFDPLIRQNLVNMLEPAAQVTMNARMRRLRALYSELMATGMMDGSIRVVDLDVAENVVFASIFSASARRLAATPLHQTWSPADERVSASEAYFEPLIMGFAT